MIKIEEVIDSLLFTDTAPKTARKILSYFLGDDLENTVTCFAGKLALNKRNLDEVGLSKDNIRMLRYLCLVMEEGDESC